MALVPRVFGQRSSVFDPLPVDLFNPFSLDLFDPFQSLTTPVQSLTTPFPSLAARTAFNDETAALVNTRIDWRETPEAHVFKADLPGLKKEEVKVEVEEGNVLQISGEKNKEEVEDNDRWYRVERSSGKFLRRFRLPENARMDQVKATMENGVLTVTVPKVGVRRPEVKAIKIDG